MIIIIIIGSGSTHKTASAAAQKMSLDAVGGSMDKMTTISSGFKFLEYELKYRSEDWRLLGDFLTENVRFFKEMVNPDLIPIGFVDPNVSSPPKIPSGGSNSGEYDEYYPRAILECSNLKSLPFKIHIDLKPNKSSCGKFVG